MHHFKKSIKERNNGDPLYMTDQTQILCNEMLNTKLQEQKAKLGRPYTQYLVV